MRDQRMRMQPSGGRELEEAPLYVRWNPENSKFAIELRLDLVGRLEMELRFSQRNHGEIGGLLLGSRVSGSPPILRIEDFQIVQSAPSDNAVFLLDPTEYERLLAQPRPGSQARSAVVGLFRTHSRPGPLRPSLADRVLLSSKAADQSFLLLLIHASPLRTAAFFVGSKTQFPDEPAVPEFTFSEGAFSALPEVSPEAVAGSRKQRLQNRVSSFWVLASFLAIVTAGLIGFLYWTSLGGERVKTPELTVEGRDVLTVRWNHAATDIQKAASARVTISDGSRRTEVVIGPDELRLGTLAYLHTSSIVQVQFVLKFPEGNELPLSAGWHG